MGTSHGVHGQHHTVSGVRVVPTAVNGGFMSAEIMPATPAEAERPWGSAPDERGSLGTLCWQRAVKVAGLAGAVAALTAASIAAGHLARVPGPPTQAHPASVIVTPQRAPVP